MLYVCKFIFILSYMCIIIVHLKKTQDYTVQVFHKYSHYYYIINVFILAFLILSNKKFNNFTFILYIQFIIYIFGLIG